MLDIFRIAAQKWAARAEGTPLQLTILDGLCPS